MIRSSLLRPARLLMAAMILPGLLAGAAHASGEAPEVKEIRQLASPSRVTFPELAEYLGYLGPIKLKTVGTATGGPQGLQAVVTGDADYGMSFNGSILNLRAAKAPLKAVISFYGTDEKTWRGLYVLENSPIRTPQDLVGKKVGVNTLGAYFEFIVKEYLRRGGVSQEDIRKVVFVPLPFISTEQSLRQGVIDAAILEDVFRERAVEKGGVRLLQSDYDLLGPFQAATIALHEKFIEKNPVATRIFVSGTARAIEWAREHPREEVIATFKKIIHERRRPNEVDTVVDFWKSVGVGARGGVISEREFSLFLDWLVANGQIKPGVIRAGDAWTNEFNVYAAKSS
ncbi:MAG: ABC transporter substrate-binding protein [Xenophilus sp.]